MRVTCMAACRNIASCRRIRMRMPRCISLGEDSRCQPFNTFHILGRNKARRYATYFVSGLFVSVVEVCQVRLNSCTSIESIVDKFAIMQRYRNGIFSEPFWLRLLLPEAKNMQRANIFSAALETDDLRNMECLVRLLDVWLVCTIWLSEHPLWLHHSAQRKHNNNELSSRSG